MSKESYLFSPLCLSIRDLTPFRWLDSNMTSCIFTSAILICRKKYYLLSFPVKIHVSLSEVLSIAAIFTGHRNSRSGIMVVSKNSYFNRIMNFQKKTLKKQYKKIIITKTYFYGHFFKSLCNKKCYFNISQ